MRDDVVLCCGVAALRVAKSITTIKEVYRVCKKMNNESSDTPIVNRTEIQDTDAANHCLHTTILN